jgi:DNA replication protein DnaC
MDLNKLKSEIVDSCLICKGQGRILIRDFKDGISEKYQECSCRAEYNSQVRYWEALDKSGIPKYYHGKIPVPSSAIKLAQNMSAFNFFAPGKQGIIFIGKYRSGKTTLACFLLKKALLDGKSVKFWEVPTLMESLQEAEFSAEKDFSIMRDCREVDILCLDDLGSNEKLSEYTDRKLSMIINHRYSNNLMTIFTSNAGTKEIQSQLGPRIWERVKEYCLIVTI